VEVSCISLHVVSELRSSLESELSEWCNALVSISNLDLKILNLRTKP
jgi:hypothetical protein